MHLIDHPNIIWPESGWVSSYAGLEVLKPDNDAVVTLVGEPSDNSMSIKVESRGRGFDGRLMVKNDDMALLGLCYSIFQEHLGYRLSDLEETEI